MGQAKWDDIKILGYVVCPSVGIYVFVYMWDIDIKNLTVCQLKHTGCTHTDCSQLALFLTLLFFPPKSQHGAPPRDVGDPVEAGHARHLPGGLHPQVPLREGLHPREGGRQRRQGHDQALHHLRHMGRLARIVCVTVNRTRSKMNIFLEIRS